MAGAAALLLQMNPALTGAQLKALVHASARHDAFTGTTPNLNWGYGKLDLATAADMIARTIPASPSLSAGALTFAAQTVGTTSAAKTVKLTNKGTAALTITSIAASGDFQVKSDACPYRLGAGASCAVSITFHPLAKGTADGTLTFKDININSPEAVTLSGTGK